MIRIWIIAILLASIHIEVTAGQSIIGNYMRGLLGVDARACTPNAS